MLPKNAVIAALLVLVASPAAFGAAASVESQLQDLAAQNHRLQEQVDAQQKLIDRLSTRLGEVERAAGSSPSASPSPGLSAKSEGELRISGEAGLAYFDTQANGFSPNREVRVDDAKIFLDAGIWKDTFLFAGMELSSREANDEFFHVGELYLDFENVSALWGRDRALNIRAGRFYIPFGEEYQERGVMENPLISHSLSDIWGIDEGLEVYGSLGRIDYVAAVQNGGIKTMRDFDADKSLSGRLSFSPASWLRLSASAMRTGDLSAAGDTLSATWFGGGFFRALAPAANFPTFDARLYGADAIAHWASGNVHLNGGQVRFGDSGGDRDARRMSYYGIEAAQNLLSRWYAAARYSRVRAPQGYALTGLGNFGTYFFGNSITDDLHRLSLGLGYRFAAPLVWKAEYSFESGRMTYGQKREKEDMISSEVGVRF